FATTTRRPVCLKRMRNRARPRLLVTARRPARRTTAPRTTARFEPARTTTLIVTRRFTGTRFGATATRSFVIALKGARIAHELWAGALRRTTVTNTTSAAPHAATRSTGAPGAERIAPPRTSAAYRSGC